jgi:hypothetical protein
LPVVVVGENLSIFPGHNGRRNWTKKKKMSVVVVVVVVELSPLF